MSFTKPTYQNPEARLHVVLRLVFAELKVCDDALRFLVILWVKLAPLGVEARHFHAVARHLQTEPQISRYKLTDMNSEMDAWNRCGLLAA